MAGVLPDGQRNLAFGLYYAGYGVGWLIGESIAQMLGARRCKSRAMAVLSTYLAGLCDHSDALVPGERGVVDPLQRLLLAACQLGAR